MGKNWWYLVTGWGKRKRRNQDFDYIMDRNSLRRIGLSLRRAFRSVEFGCHWKCLTNSGKSLEPQKLICGSVAKRLQVEIM